MLLLKSSNQLVSPYNPIAVEGIERGENKMKFEYERNNIIKSLKNEIYGINQLVSHLQEIKQGDYTKLDSKVLNVKFERALKENCKGYITTGYDTIKLIVSERYNNETQSYIDFYQSRTVKISINKEISEAGKQTDRLNLEGTLKNIDNEIESLLEAKKELETELQNIDKTMLEYAELYSQVVQFKKNRTSFFLDQVQNLNRFY